NQSAGLFEDAQITLQCLGLFPSRQSGPQGIKSRDVFVARTLPGLKVVVEEQAALGIPKILLNSRFPLICAATPLLAVVPAPQHLAHPFEVLLGLVKQTVKTDGGIVVSLGSKSTKAEGDIKPRLAHGAVTVVIVRAERNRCRRFATGFRHGFGQVAQLYGILESNPSLAAIGSHQITSRRTRVQQEIVGYFAIGVGFVLQALGSCSFAEIVIPC